MSLGGAFLIVWNDIASDIRREYERWHRVEHMPERMAIPGFVKGRRYVNADQGARQRYLTIYETQSIEIFQSEAYHTRVMNPTEWTKRMSAGLEGFLRRICRTSASVGQGVGGTVATIQLSATTLPVDVDALLLEIPEIVAIHHGVIDRQTTFKRTDSLQTRNVDQEMDFGSVLVVEATGREDMAIVISAISAELEKASDRAALIQVYDLAFVL